MLNYTNCINQKQRTYVYTNTKLYLRMRRRNVIIIYEPKNINRLVITLLVFQGVYTPNLWSL